MPAMIMLITTVSCPPLTLVKRQRVRPSPPAGACGQVEVSMNNAAKMVGLARRRTFRQVLRYAFAAAVPAVVAVSGCGALIWRRDLVSRRGRRRHGCHCRNVATVEFSRLIGCKQT